MDNKAVKPAKVGENQVVMEKAEQLSKTTSAQYIYSTSKFSIFHMYVTTIYPK